MKCFAFAIGFLTLSLLSGCSTPALQESPAYKAATANAFAELNETHRTPAAEADTLALKKNFNNLRQQSRYLVFPKISNITEKNSEAVEQMFWAPKTFNIVSPLLLSCKAIKTHKDKEFNHQIFFASAPDKNSCAVLKYTFAESINKNLLGLDDILEVRVYIDSDYRGYGVDYVKYRGPQKTEVVSVKTDVTLPVTSGLTFIPTDIPVLEMLKITQSQFQFSDDEYVKGKLDKIKVGLPCAKAATYSYKETYGSTVSGAWCAGDPLPTKIETAHYLAFLRKNN